MRNADDIKIQSPQDAATPELPGKRLLVAEDNELNWEIANELLQTLGLELEWAENGQLCVDMFRQSPPGYYDGILMDIRIPVMDGYEATDAIRAMDRPDVSLPIIAMAADACSEDVQKCSAHGMNALCKPTPREPCSRGVLYPDLRPVIPRRRPVRHWPREHGAAPSGGSADRVQVSPGGLLVYPGNVLENINVGKGLVIKDVGIPDHAQVFDGQNGDLALA